MLWFLLSVIAVTIVIVGRSHSKRQDELDDLHARGYLNPSWRRDPARDFMTRIDG
jgi:hypothetical protein